ncbi:Alpha-taxilin [Manis javanica]|nr:Alpha-taxilin [Manis javanica]
MFSLFQATHATHALRSRCCGPAWPFAGPGSGAGARADAAADAAAWPAKPVRIVVAFAPAGAADILARSLGEVLQRELKQPFVVDNRPGAGGNIGTDNAAKAPGDGYSCWSASTRPSPSIPSSTRACRSRARTCAP